MSHWTNNFHECESNKWKVRCRWKRCPFVSHTPAHHQINQWFLFNLHLATIHHHTIAFNFDFFHSQPHAANNFHRVKNIYMNCPPYFLHCACACASCTRRIYYDYAIFTFHPKIYSPSRNLPLLLLLLLLPLISRFPFSRSIFVLTMCTVLAWTCERKPWMFSFVFRLSPSVRMVGWLWCVLALNTKHRYTHTRASARVWNGIGRVSADDICDVCALVIYFPRRFTHTGARAHIRN